MERIFPLKTEVIGFFLFIERGIAVLFRRFGDKFWILVLIYLAIYIFGLLLFCKFLNILEDLKFEINIFLYPIPHFGGKLWKF